MIRVRKHRACSGWGFGDRRIKYITRIKAERFCMERRHAMKTDSCRSGASALSLQQLGWKGGIWLYECGANDKPLRSLLALLSVIDLCFLIIELTVRCWLLNVCFGIYVYLLFIFKTWRWADWTFLPSSWVRMKPLFVSSTLLRNRTEHCTDMKKDRDY